MTKLEAFMIVATTCVMFFVGAVVGSEDAKKKTRQEDVEACRQVIVEVRKQDAKLCEEWCESRSVFAPDDAEVQR